MDFLTAPILEKYFARHMEWRRESIVPIHLSGIDYKKITDAYLTDTAEYRNKSVHESSSVVYYIISKGIRSQVLLWNRRQGRGVCRNDIRTFCIRDHWSFVMQCFPDSEASFYVNERVCLCEKIQ